MKTKNNIGILLRGKSLEKFPLIKDKFEDCYIVNDWKKEIEIFSEFFKEKNIIHFVNSLKATTLSTDQYRKFNIDKTIFSFSKSMFNKKFNIVNLYKKYGILDIKYLPEKYTEICKKIRNTGICCILYVSEIVKPKQIWIIGLDFYRNDYMTKANSSYHLQKSKDIKMVDSFIKIVDKHPDIQYKLVTYFKDLPRMKNLELKYG